MASKLEFARGARAHPAGFFVLRRPLRVAATGLLGDAAPLQAACDPAKLRTLLRGDPHLLPAVYLASPTLHAAAVRWLALPLQAPDEVPPALTRYLLRALHRPTPFGLFGLIATGDIGDVTQFPEVHEPGQLKLVHRLSYAAETALRRLQAADVYRPNTTLWRRGEELRAWACLDGEEETCAQVACPVDEETQVLVDPQSAHAVDGERARRELSDLVTAGLLVGAGQAGSVFHGVAVPPWQKAGHPVRWPSIGKELAELDALSLTDPRRATHYQAFDASITQALADGATRRSALDACCFVRPGAGADPVLAADVAERLAQTALQLVSCFGAPHRALRSLLPEFAERFSHESVPLLALVDSDLGQQFAACLSSPGPDRSPDFEGYDRYFLREVVEAIEAGRDVVRLTWERIRSLVPPRPCSSRLVAPVASLVHGHPQAVRPSIQWRGLEVHCGTALLSRFEGLDPNLNAKVSEWLQANDDLRAGPAVRAEVVYVPHPRVGDVLRRPARTRHALYVGGCPDVGGPAPVALQSLHVRLRDGRFELWSSEMGAQVIPVLSVPHHYAASQHGVYRLLCALALQDVEVARLRIPEAVHALHRCPRVVVDDIVFRPATWSVALPASAHERTDVTALRRLLSRQGVPRQFGWGHLDRFMVIDSTSDRDIKAFSSDIARQDHVVLSEVLAPPTALGPHEIVLPVRLVSVEKPRATASPPMDKEPPTTPVPDDRHVYLQLFADPQRVDRLPLELQARLQPWFRRSGLSWFFIKYSVPSPHLRLRVRLNEGDRPWRVIRRLCEEARKLRQQGLVDAFTLAEFHPEVERYGGAARWPWSVDYFIADTAFACTIGRHAMENDLDREHGVFAMAVSCLHIGLDFGLSASEVAHALCRAREDRTPAWLASGLLLRQLRPLVQALAAPASAKGFGRLLVEAARARSEATALARRALRDSFERGSEWTTWLFRSHAHMSINRLRTVDTAQEEAVALCLAARLAEALPRITA